MDVLQLKLVATGRIYEKTALYVAIIFPPKIGLKGQ
jgi:hypothetical protein